MTNDTQGELLPCPFCGGTELFRTADNINMTDRINCKSCNANAVLWKWNTRTITPPVSAVMAETLESIIVEADQATDNEEMATIESIRYMARRALSAATAKPAAGEDAVLPMYIRARYISEHVYKLAYVEYENSEIGASTGALDFCDVEQYRVTKEEAEK